MNVKVARGQAVAKHEAVHVLSPLDLNQRPGEAANENPNRPCLVLRQIAKAGHVPLRLHDQPPKRDVRRAQEVAVTCVDQSIGPDDATLDRVALSVLVAHET